MEQKRELSIPCNTKQLRLVRETMDELLGVGRFDEDEMFNLHLVIDEAVINAIDHGSANNMKMNVDITFILKDYHLGIIVKDYGGKSFNPDFFERIAEKKNWGRGGRGIFLIKQFMDEVRYIFNPGQSTLLYMAKSMSPASIINAE